MVSEHILLEQLLLELPPGAYKEDLTRSHLALIPQHYGLEKAAEAHSC